MQLDYQYLSNHDEEYAQKIRASTNGMIRTHNQQPWVQQRKVDEIINKLVRRTSKRVKMDIAQVSIQDQQRIGDNWEDKIMIRCMELGYTITNSDITTKCGRKGNGLCRKCGEHQIDSGKRANKLHIGDSPKSYLIFCRTCNYDFYHKYSVCGVNVLSSFF